ncbi:hypothetical protein ACE1TI_16110 [Alteribacillus sp. JSM 102045]|uniref:hypothetical protein n=1 Tax=Alteribacillus sp. JSM 102045 TaxID=1562101 RepID=UPI0035C1F6D9
MEGERVGELRSLFSLFAKRFKYEAIGRGSYLVESEAFSQEESLPSQMKEAVIK